MALEKQDNVGGDLPVAVGGGHIASAAANTHADVFIDGLALNLHITPNTTAFGGAPYRRETADQVKQQFDTSPFAGEHTLTNYWLRSQMSLHGGAGIKYLDTSAADSSQNSPTEFRFDTSRGVDVWTKGEIKRLPDTALMAATSGRTWLFSTTLSSGESYLVYGSGGSVKAQRQNANDTITYTVTGMAGTIKDMVIDGSNYYVATTDGHIYRGPIDNSAAGTALWDFVSTSDVTLGWSKQRLLAAVNNSVYELAGTGPALPAPTYTHPNAAWRWTCFSEGPNAVVAAGAAGTASTIYSFTLSSSGGAAPTLQPGISIASLPVGETVNCLYFYAGEHLVLGTSVGLRVGIFQSFYGTFSYGSLTFPSRLSDSAPVTSLSGRGSFVYAGTRIDGEASLIRVDLGTQTDQTIYAWAPDLRCPSAIVGNVTSVCVDSQLRLRFAVQGYGVVGETSSFGGRDAWVRTGRIRFNTVESKHFKYGRVRSEGTGSVTVEAAADTTATDAVYTFDASDHTSQRFSLIAGPAEWVQLTFHLTSGSSVLTSYQVMALPAGARSRLITLPVQIFDQEKNRHGITVAAPGRAKKILDALEAYEATGDELTLQVPCLGISAVRVTVEKFTFQQNSNPSRNKKVDVGGYGTLVFRTTS